MVVNDNVVLAPNDLSITRYKFTPTTQGAKGNLVISTLDGTQSGTWNLDFQDNNNNKATGMVILDGGTYEGTDKNNVFRRNITYDDGSTGYYEIQAYNDLYGSSAPWEYVYFRNVVGVLGSGNNYVVQTVL